MTTDWRALCTEILKMLDYYMPQDGRLTCWDSWRDRARAALAEEPEPEGPTDEEPEPEGPTDEELRELWQNSWDTSEEHGAFQFARAVLARWGHQPAPPADGEQRHPTPVPVAERLPGPEDCDAGGRCWFFIDGAQWAIDGAHWALEDRTYGCNRHRSHWLPAHALPLPAGEVEP